MEQGGSKVGIKLRIMRYGPMAYHRVDRSPVLR